MRLSGWIFMAIAWTLILSLATFCFSRIFKKGQDKGGTRWRVGRVDGRVILL